MRVVNRFAPDSKKSNEFDNFSIGFSINGNVARFLETPGHNFAFFPNNCRYYDLTK